MADELSIIGVPNVEISFSSPIDIATTLISSIASVHNVKSITRAKYAEIQAALKAYDGILKAHERDFADKMLRQKENLENLYRLLEIAFEGARTGSGENAKYCRDIALGLMQVIEQVNKNGPPIANVYLNL